MKYNIMNVNKSATQFYNHRLFLALLVEKKQINFNPDLRS